MSEQSPAAASGSSMTCGPMPEGTTPDWQYVWESRFGLIVIEVLDDRVFVNGYPVDLIKDAAVPAAARAWVPI